MLLLSPTFREPEVLSRATLRRAAWASGLYALVPLVALLGLAPRPRVESRLVAVRLSAVRDDDGAAHTAYHPVARPTRQHRAQLVGAARPAQCDAQPGLIDWRRVGDWPARVTAALRCDGVPLRHWQTPPLARGREVGHETGYDYGTQWSCASGALPNHSDQRALYVRTARDGSLLEFECRLNACVDGPPIADPTGRLVSATPCKVLRAQGSQYLLLQRDGLAIRARESAARGPAASAERVVASGAASLAAVALWALFRRRRRAVEARLRGLWQAARVDPAGGVWLDGLRVAALAPGPSEAVLRVDAAGLALTPYRRDRHGRIVEVVPGNFDTLSKQADRGFARLGLAAVGGALLALGVVLTEVLSR